MTWRYTTAMLRRHVYEGPFSLRRRFAMTGIISHIRDGNIDGCTFQETIHEWREGKAELAAVLVAAGGGRGVVLAYSNRPVHQVGNPGLDNYLAALDKVEKLEGIDFLILTGPCDPVHAGGDLKESLGKLDESNAERVRLEKAGATVEETDRLFDWGDARLAKGMELYRRVRRLSKRLRTVAICGGGTRFGGSAEVCLMADRIVGDSRSGMSFSESQIGLIPGWAGVARAITKAGASNARYLASTATISKAATLRAIGIYDSVVEIEDPLPRMKKTGDKDGDRAAYAAALEENDGKSGRLLLTEALRMGAGETVGAEDAAGALKSAEELAAEVARRSDPMTYEGLWGRPLGEVKGELKELGRPLAPQSIAALDRLFEGLAGAYDEEAFAEDEMKADAALYRDRRFRAGIVATLSQIVADFREVDR